MLIFGPLRNALGLSRIRVAYTAGEAIGPDIFVFFRSLGINLKQLYGQTESSVYCCMQTDNDVQPDTVGPPAPGVEMKIAEDGEIMYRSPGVFIGYYKNQRRQLLPGHPTAGCIRAMLVCSPREDICGWSTGRTTSVV